MRAALLLLVATLAQVGCHSRPTIERRTGDGARQPLASDRIVAPGIVEPWGGETRLAPNEQGQIVELHVREGDVVVLGQPLARLDDATQAHAVALASAELAEARALRRRIVRGSTSEEVALARADRASAETRAVQAKRDEARARSLSDAGGLPGADAERASSEASSLASSLAAAEARLGIVLRVPRLEDREAAAAREAAAETRLAAAQGALARRRINSPLAGTILWSRRHVGELFVPGAEPLVVIGDVQRLQIRAEVDELDAPTVSAAARCEAFTDTGARAAACTLDRLSPGFGRRSLFSEAPTSRSDVRVRETFVLVDAGSSLAPGQRLWVHFQAKTGEGE